MPTMIGMSMFVLGNALANALARVFVNKDAYTLIHQHKKDPFKIIEAR